MKAKHGQGEVEDGEGERRSYMSSPLESYSSKENFPIAMVMNTTSAGRPEEWWGKGEEKEKN